MWLRKRVIPPLGLQMRSRFWPTPWPLERPKQRIQLSHAHISDSQKFFLFLHMLSSDLRCIPNPKSPEPTFSHCPSASIQQASSCLVLGTLRARMSRTWADTERLYSGSVIKDRYSREQKKKCFYVTAAQTFTFIRPTSMPVVVRKMLITWDTLKWKLN